MRKVLADILLFAYLTLLLNLTRFLDTGPIPPSDERLNLVPFKTIVYDLNDRGFNDGREPPRESFAFAPLGFLVPLLQDSRTGAPRIGLLSMALSLLIETFQYHSGSRIADVDDVLVDTLSGLLGYGIWTVPARSARRIV